MGKDADQTYQTALYNLDVIISAGYRVKSQRGTQFRIWANKILKDYLVKGYAVNKALAEQRYTEQKQFILMVHGWQRHPLQYRRHETYSRQHPCRPYTDDCRKPHGGKGCNGKSSCEPDKQEQL